MRLISTAIVALALLLTAGLHSQMRYERVSPIASTGESATDISAPAVYADSAAISLHGSAPAGVTIEDAGELRAAVAKIVVPYTAFVTNATVSNMNLAVIPMRSRLVALDAEITTPFACAAVCTSSTLSMIVGSAIGQSNYLVSFDVDASTNWLGDADAELGTALTRATAVQGGFAFTAADGFVSLRLTSGTGNIGNGTVTNLSQGSITFYVQTRRLD